jgi:formylglycine-generating enzyme required for sulfatase activity
MVRAVEAFTNNITGGDEVVVFFAGHGVQIRNGSYLLPTDIEANSESEVEKTAYELLALTDKISEAKPAFSLVMVDACRDNPLKSKGRNIGNSRGLSAIEPPKGQMVVYSASRGQQALDRLSDKDPNPNGVFTREFITQMQKPGVRIEDIMRSVQDSVETLARSVNHEQRPAVYNEARGNFYFFGPTTVQVVPAQQKPDTNAIELALWDSVKNATTAVEIQAYLNRFPNGFFSEVARVRIDALGRASVERITAENTLRLAEEARTKEQQRLALEAQNKEKARLAQVAEQKEQERILADQRAQEQERVATLNAQKLADERAKEEAERKVALERAQRLAAQSEAERLANKPPANLTPPQTSEAQIAQSEFDRVIEQARLEFLESRLETEKSVQDFINRNTPGSSFKDCETCPEMVVISAGSFQMGSSVSWFSSKKPPENEQPSRNVSVKGFAMGKFEVTQKQWRELMGNDPSKFKGDELPVEQVSWEDVQIFLGKLSSKTGKVYRLPSESEWEYSALAGEQTEYPSGDTISGLNRLAWYKEISDSTEVVGTKASNKFGLFDMYGNVEEWTSDCSNQNYVKAPTDGSPWLEGLCSFRVVRGGAWSHSVKYLRSKSRHQAHQRSKEDNLGFRVVRDLFN